MCVCVLSEHSYVPHGTSFELTLTERYFSLQEKLATVGLSLRQGTESTHLACGSNTLPDAEKTDEPDQEEAEREVPFQTAWVVNSGGQTEHIAPLGKENKRSEVRGRGPLGSQASMAKTLASVSGTMTK